MISSAILDKVRTALPKLERHICFDALLTDVEHPGIIEGTGVPVGFAADGARAIAVADVAIVVVDPDPARAALADGKALEFITGYLIDVQNETHGPRTIEKSLQGYYKTIGCRLISMPEHQIGVNRGRFHGKRFTIICDDEALFVDQPKISAIDNLGQPMLCGNLFIVKTDDQGDTVSLDPADIKYLEQFVLLQGTRKFPRPYPILHQCEYA